MGHEAYPRDGGMGRRMSDIQALSEEAKDHLREQNPNWAYDMCCGECVGGCYVDKLTGA